MHVSCMFQHISCAQIQKVLCMKFPVTILNNLKFHACYMHDSWNMHVTCRDLGHFSGMGHACYMHGLVPKFHACSMHEKYGYFMHETCMFQVYSMHSTSVFQAWYRHIPCVVQAYSMRDTGVFHAWYRRIPSMIQVYSMRGTGVIHVWYRRIPWYRDIPFMCAYTVQLQAYFSSPWTEYLYYTCCKHKALCSCIGKYALYRYVDTGFKEKNRQSLLAPIDMHIML